MDQKQSEKRKDASSGIVGTPEKSGSPTDPTGADPRKGPFKGKLFEKITKAGVRGDVAHRRGLSLKKQGVYEK